MLTVIESWTRMLPSSRDSNKVTTRTLEHREDGTWLITEVVWNLDVSMVSEEGWTENIWDSTEPQKCNGYVDEPWIEYARFDQDTARWKRIQLLS